MYRHVTNRLIDGNMMYISSSFKPLEPDKKNLNTRSKLRIGDRDCRRSESGRPCERIDSGTTIRCLRSPPGPVFKVHRNLSIVITPQSQQRYGSDSVRICCVFCPCLGQTSLGTGWSATTTLTGVWPKGVATNSHMKGGSWRTFFSINGTNGLLRKKNHLIGNHCFQMPIPKSSQNYRGRFLWFTGSLGFCNLVLQPPREISMICFHLLKLRRSTSFETVHFFHVDFLEIHEW